MTESHLSRSHFEAQDMLESGADQRLNSGWLNRAASHMPAATGHEIALSIGLSPPLILRGPATVEAWAPDHFTQPSAELYQRLLDVSSDDPIIGPSVAEGFKQRGFNAHALAGQATYQSHDRGFEVLAAAAGRLLAQKDGPRLAALELGGWDTRSVCLHQAHHSISVPGSCREPCYSARSMAYPHPGQNRRNALNLTVTGRTGNGRNNFSKRAWAFGVSTIHFGREAA
jgi:uncharacterized protein (DUF1501 family)